jgi:hypothetical protein
VMPSTEGGDGLAVDGDLWTHGCVHDTAGHGVAGSSAAEAQATAPRTMSGTGTSQSCANLCE